MEKTLVILRHAHRDKEMGFAADNGLSSEGVAQAMKIRRHFQKEFSDQEALILSSPKLRCVETVQGIAEDRGIEIVTPSILDEGGDLIEKADLFRRFLDGSSVPVICACSHGDLIPVLLERLCGNSIVLSKGGWVQLSWEQRAWQLKWIIQSFDPF